MQNAEYASLLTEIAQRLHVVGANGFRIRAFENAARAISRMAEPIEPIIQAGEATSISGIGKGIAAELKAISERGSSDVLDELRASLPHGIIDLLRIQGMGPKKVAALYQKLGIGDIDTLEDMAKDGQLSALKGFGQKTQENILKEIDRLRRDAGRTPIARALPVAARVVEFLRGLPEVEQAEIAGSLRRGKETVGDLDFVVASNTPDPIMDAWCAMPIVEDIVSKGSTKSTVYFPGGLSADLRVVPPEVFGATLHHFTGSKEHNVEMRRRALARGLRVSEWGVFKLNEDGSDDRETPVACLNEEDIFTAVGLPWIAPEFRQGDGEISAAEQGTLHAPLALSDMAGDLHMHTVWSDGKNSIEEMAHAAAERGLSYICITDHSQALTVANGLNEERLLAQIDEIDALNAKGLPVRVFKGLEVDILVDGSLDMSAEVLERLDWVVGSVHSRMKQSHEEMTSRLLAAVRSGLISAVGHPTGRLIGRRDPYSFDLHAVFDACQEMGVALEVNASPSRLDLNASMLREALKRDGLWITINTDAHSTAMLDQMAFGLQMANRGWVPKERVLNSLATERFLESARKPRAV